jgi:demethylmenaquinone methyltransferase/2-methoxy-6-polyprenyl-1,4-benzoquinol methylase
VSEIGKPIVVGAAPEGASDQASAARAVREMFTSIAPRYDLLNHVLSFNVDRVWWRRTARTFSHILTRSDARVLDLCCGTGDMAFALRRKAGKSPARVVGADFSHAMLQRANTKFQTMPTPPGWVEADALSLPFPAAHFDLVTSAFGFRNLADYDAGLREILRVLRPGGEAGILDFGEPSGVMGAIYRIYFKQILPRVGTLISGIRGPYAYLPASVGRFPAPQEMIARMKRAGFAEAAWTPYTFGIAGLYRGKKSA